MPQFLSSILIHMIFSTKNREPFITPAIETELHPVSSVTPMINCPPLSEAVT